MKTKEKLIIVLLSIVIAGISYCFFWDGYYSIDTYRIISQGYTDYALKDAYIRDGISCRNRKFGWNNKSKL